MIELGRTLLEWNRSDLTLLYDIFRFHAYALYQKRSAGARASNLSVFFLDFAIRRVR